MLDTYPVIGARALSIHLCNNTRDAYPIFLNGYEYDFPTGKKDLMLKFALTQMPEPDENVSWEQILEFREDGDTQKNIMHLLNG